jgi:hypothetical protein
LTCTQDGRAPPCWSPESPPSLATILILLPAPHCSPITHIPLHCFRLRCVCLVCCRIFVRSIWRAQRLAPLLLLTPACSSSEPVSTRSPNRCLPAILGPPNKSRAVYALRQSSPFSSSSSPTRAHIFKSLPSECGRGTGRLRY